LIGLPILKHEVCEYACIMGFYELKLVCLVWNKSWIGWLVEYWHGIM